MLHIACVKGDTVLADPVNAVIADIYQYLPTNPVFIHLNIAIMPVKMPLTTMPSTAEINKKPEFKTIRQI